MNQTTDLILLLTGGISLSGMLCCWLYVVIVLFRKDNAIQGGLGLLVLPYAYVIGWLRHRRLGLETALLIWTALGVWLGIVYAAVLYLIGF